MVDACAADMSLTAAFRECGPAYTISSLVSDDVDDDVDGEKGEAGEAGESGSGDNEGEEEELTTKLATTRMCALCRARKVAKESRICCIKYPDEWGGGTRRQVTYDGDMKKEKDEGKRERK